MWREHSQDHTIEKLNAIVDVFINHSYHSMDYEMREYETVASELSPNVIVIGDNSHFSDKLVNFAAKTKRDFLYYQVQAKDHWYPGGEKGVAYIHSKS